MKGFEVMIVGLCTAMHSATNCTDNRHLIDIDGDTDINNSNISLADTNMKYTEDKKPMEIKVTTYQDMPYSGFMEINGKLVGLGYAFDVLHLVQRKMNFTYTIVLPEQMTIGDKTSGMMKLIYNKKVDLAVAFIPILTELYDLCTFSSILNEIQITLMMKRPLESATGQGILAPFSDIVWYYILGSWIIFGPTMYILVYIRSKIPDREKPEGYSFPTCVWFTYGALLKQGTTTEPETNSTRLIFATWWIFITILTSFYTANLTAFLTLSEFTLPYNTAKDIADDHQHWVAFKNHAIDEALKKDTSDYLEPLRRSVERKQATFIDDQDGFPEVLNWIRKRYLFLGDRYSIVKVIANDYLKWTDEDAEEKYRCPFVMQPDNLYVLSRAFAFPLGSPYYKEMNKHLMFIAETGIVKHLETKGLPGVAICPLNLKSKERQLRNRDLLMTYKAMVLGFSLAAVAFLCEVILSFLIRKKCCSCCSDFICCQTNIETPVVPITSADHLDKQFVVSKQNSFSTFENIYPNQRLKKSMINGREYWIIMEKDGDRRLVPIRTPSALLFHHTNEFS